MGECGSHLTLQATVPGFATRSAIAKTIAENPIERRLQSPDDFKSDVSQIHFLDVLERNARGLARRAAANHHADRMLLREFMIPLINLRIDVRASGLISHNED